MSNSTSPETREFILPFSVPSENRKSLFTSDLENASIFALSEYRRTKGGGRLLKQPEEKTLFIVKVGYPIWLFPSGERALVFDGLNRASYTMQYSALPDVKSFLEELRRSSKTLETYEAFLSDYVNYFQASMTEKSSIVKGLIGTPDFLKVFRSFRGEALELAEQPANMALLSSVLDESAISSAVLDIEKLQLSLREEAAGLKRGMRLTNKITRHYIREVRVNALAGREEFEARIKEQEEIVAPQVAKIREDYDSQIISSTKNYEQQILPVQRDIIKLEKSKQQALSTIEKTKGEAKSRAEVDDSIGERQWKEKCSDARKELSTIEDQLKRIGKALSGLEEQKALVLKKLHSDLEASVKEARQPLLELEASRDAQTLIHKQRIEKLESQTKLISDLLGGIGKQRAATVAKYKQLSLKRELSSGEIGLYYVPLYITCYHVELKKRYLILPPSLANSVRFSTKLKGALGGTRIKGLLVPRFKTLDSLMDNIQVLIQQNPPFEAEIGDKGQKFNLLRASSVREEIRKGLVSLRNEGWLTEKEFEDLNQKIV